MNAVARSPTPAPSRTHTWLRGSLGGSYRVGGQWKAKPRMAAPLAHSHTSSVVETAVTETVLVATRRLASHLVRNKGKLGALSLPLFPSLGEDSPPALNTLRRKASVAPQHLVGGGLVRWPPVRPDSRTLRL